MLTNYRDVANIKPSAPTRGKLVSDYLKGGFRPKDYLLALSKTEADNAFKTAKKFYKEVCVFLQKKSLQKNLFEDL